MYDIESHLTPDFFRFVDGHLSDDPAALRLQCKGKSDRLGFDPELAVTQIECRRKTRRKLADFLQHQDFIFPDTLAAEQSSHQAVAKFHASLVAPGSDILDMTAGLGIDILTMARNARSATACELNPVKADALRHNAGVLGLSNLDVICGDSTALLTQPGSPLSVRHFDTVFVDPARRSDSNARLYNLHDCSPDILSILPDILNRCGVILIKASPLLDISRTLADIPQADCIWTVGVQGECKEVLVRVPSQPTGSCTLQGIDLAPDGSVISQLAYSSGEDQKEIPFLDDIKCLDNGGYLYEPNAQTMKLAPWGTLTRRFPGLVKLDASSHLFFSETLHPGFPGRVLRLERVLDRKSAAALKGEHANVAVRNYPLTADRLRKKLGLLEGLDTFVYGTRVQAKPVLLLAHKV